MKPIYENVEFDASYSIKYFQYQCDSFQKDHGWHFHPEFELSFIYSGEGTRLVGDSVEPFMAGDLVLVGPDLPHCWISSKDQTNNEMAVLQFQSEVLPAPLLNVPEITGIKLLLEKSRRGLLFSFGRESLKQRGAIERLLEGVNKSKGVARYTALLTLFDFLCRLDTASLLASEAYSTDYENFHTDRLGKVMSYIRENLSGEIKQTEAAILLNMTPQSFSRFFKASTGRTFVSFVNYMRISHACRLLMSTRLDITEIAFMCGYASLSHFNRQFSEMKKTTPSQFREQLVPGDVDYR